MIEDYLYDPIEGFFWNELGVSSYLSYERNLKIPKYKRKKFTNSMIFNSVAKNYLDAKRKKIYSEDIFYEMKYAIGNVTKFVQEMGKPRIDYEIKYKKHYF